MIAEEILILEDRNGLFERDIRVLEYLMNKFVNLGSTYTDKELAIDYANLYLDSNYAEVGYLYNQEEKMFYLRQQTNFWSDRVIKDLENLFSLNRPVNKLLELDIDEIELIRRVQSLLGINQDYEFNLREELVRVSNLAYEQLGLTSNYFNDEIDR
ncbi:MAG TPA: hypothetical protein DIC19_02620 [Erysipelotrichaceae bacterium]|nr:hypothetical protein [Erysipelotrichaceae bacterium]